LFLESLESAAEYFTRRKITEQNTKRAKAKSACVDRAKSREVVERPLPVNPESDSSEGEVFSLITESSEISLEESLQEFGDSLTAEQRKVYAEKEETEEE
jgi:hypothetical protein